MLRKQCCAMVLALSIFLGGSGAALAAHDSNYCPVDVTNFKSCVSNLSGDFMQLLTLGACAGIDVFKAYMTASPGTLYGIFDCVNQACSPKTVFNKAGDDVAAQLQDCKNEWQPVLGQLVGYISGAFGKNTGPQCERKVRLGKSGGFYIVKVDCGAPGLPGEQ